MQGSSVDGGGRGIDFGGGDGGGSGTAGAERAGPERCREGENAGRG